MADSHGYNATECGDDFFGPSVWSYGCRGGFDFTLAFEESILTILPSVLFLLLAIPRSLYLLRAKDQAKRQSTYTSKLVVSTLFAIFQVALLALVVSSKKLKTSLSIAAAVVNLLSASLIVFFSHIEHVKSIRPSYILTAYLFASLLFDAARLRTEWLISVNTAYAVVLSVSTALKLALLALETVEKRRILIEKDASPSKESTSGPLNQGLFLWLNSLLVTGWATVLTNNDLPTIYEQLASSRLSEIYGAKWERATRGGRKPSLFVTTVKILKWQILRIALPRLARAALAISQPFLVANALRFLSMPDSESTTNLGYGLIGAFALVFIGSAITTAWYEYLTFRAAAMVRGGLIMLVYRKMVKLPSENLAESSALTLMGNDIETMVERLNYLVVESWANLITVIASVYLLWMQLGAVCVAPIIMALISLALSSLIGGKMVTRQTSYQKATQARINFTSEVLGSMKSVRMLGYSERFSQMIEKKREDDLDGGKHYRWLIIWSNAVSNANLTLTQAATFGAYAVAAKIQGNQAFSASQAITALSILGVMMEPLSVLLGSIPSSFAVIGCFRRVQDFLYLDEQVENRVVSSTPAMAMTKGTSEGRASTSTSSIEMHKLDKEQKASRDISVVDGNFNWKDTTVLTDINTSIPHDPKGSLTMIVGPVGSGKSSFLKAILGEVGTATGVVSLANPEIAFCDQTPWIMNATIRENVVAETKGYDEAWFDSVVEACDLALDIARLPDGSQTTVGSKGLKLSGGQKQRLAMARAVYSRKPIAIFDDVFSGLDKVTEQTVFNRVFGADGLLRRNGTTIILATHSVHRLPESDNIIAIGQGGTIIEQGTFSDLRLGGKYIQSLDISGSEESDEEAGEALDPLPSSTAGPPKPQAEASQERQQRSSDTATFKYYFSSVRPITLAIGTLYILLQAFLNVFRSVWVTWWGDGRGHSSSNVGYWLSIYTVMAVAEAVFVSVAILHFLLIVGPSSGRSLHQRILNAAMSASTSFLSNTETGSLINRFSQDIRLVDIVLPVALAVFLFETVTCLGIMGLAIAAVKWVAIAFPFVILILVLIQRFYVKTSKQLRILEIEHKAPLYSHFLESIQGLVTIRAFGWTRPYVEKSLVLLDDAQKPAYLLHCIQRWLTLVLDLVVAALTILLVVFAVVLRTKVNPSLLGVALVNLMNMSLFLKGIIIQWSTLETALGAVARIKDFEENTPSEVFAEENKQTRKEWPERGGLEIKNLAVQYDPTAEPILRGVSLSIKHGEKIGLCGRSGSGKSSFIQALLRMTEVCEGEILLDGEDITKVPRYLVRQKLSCLTQEPFLFTNTVRFNADPLEQSSDEAIVNSLVRVGLWEVIRSKTEGEKDPLDENMSENFLSHGQRQLFCLARALMKRTPVLLLDEPTSSVDSQTDAQIQEVIRTEFQDCTIIMIAHRISTLLDFDKVAVLEKGRLAEFGSPKELLEHEGGSFVKLYRADQHSEGS